MNSNKKLDLIFVKDENSMFDLGSEKFTQLFHKVDFAPDKRKALKLIYDNDYDILLHDVSVDYTNGATFITQIKQMKPTATIIALLSPKDESKVGEMIELGVDAFLLNPSDLDYALETISQREPASTK